MPERVLRIASTFAPYMCGCGHWMDRHDGPSETCVYCRCRQFHAAALAPVGAAPEEVKREAEDD